MRQFRTVIPNILYQGARPGYYHPEKKRLNIFDIIDDVSHLQDKGIKSIFCLLPGYEIEQYYNFDLLEKYQNFKFAVYQYPISDDRYMGSMLKEEQFDVDHVWRIFIDLPKPVYMHCSAGVMRSRDLAEKLYEKYAKVHNISIPKPGDFWSPFSDQTYHIPENDPD